MDQLVEAIIEGRSYVVGKPCPHPFGEGDITPTQIDYHGPNGVEIVYTDGQGRSHKAFFRDCPIKLHFESREDATQTQTG